MAQLVDNWFTTTSTYFNSAATSTDSGLFYLWSPLVITGVVLACLVGLVLVILCTSKICNYCMYGSCCFSCCSQRDVTNNSCFARPTDSNPSCYSCCFQAPPPKQVIKRRGSVSSCASRASSNRSSVRSSRSSVQSSVRSSRSSCSSSISGVKTQRRPAVKFREPANSISRAMTSRNRASRNDVIVVNGQGPRQIILEQGLAVHGWPYHQPAMSPPRQLGNIRCYTAEPPPQNSRGLSFGSAPINIGMEFGNVQLVNTGSNFQTSVGTGSGFQISPYNGSSSQVSSPQRTVIHTTNDRATVSCELRHLPNEFTLRSVNN